MLRITTVVTAFRWGNGIGLPCFEPEWCQPYRHWYCVFPALGAVPVPMSLLGCIPGTGAVPCSMGTLVSVRRGTGTGTGTGVVINQILTQNLYCAVFVC